MIIIILSMTRRIVFADCTMLLQIDIYYSRNVSAPLSPSPPPPRVRRKENMCSISLPQFNYLPLKTPSTNYTKHRLTRVTHPVMNNFSVLLVHKF